jgi:DNA-directed RNA polymerase subunit RPC12/RpoP/ribosomal protein S27E
MKCGDCGQDILQAHPEMCPYCKSKHLISDEEAPKQIHEAEQLAKAGRYEDAALSYERLDLWNKAKECRAVAKKKHSSPIDLQVGKVETISLLCPHCGSSQPANSKSAQETCNRCGTIYLIPEKIMDLI